MRRAVFVLLALGLDASLFAQSPVSYRVTFPEAQHHRMQVEVTFPELPSGPLHVLMSRTSPGRYAIHEFAKNVYDVQIDNGGGTPLTFERPNPSEWAVDGHDGTVRVRYKVFGDQTDGTFLGIDTTHAHINIPAALMWARGLENRPVRVTFEPAASSSWKVATQLHPTGDPRTFTAANLQYLVDSPTELSNFVLRTFTVEQAFRIALHHDGSERDADRFAADVERIVREERAVFGELPAFEAPYVFIGDFLPYAARDGMEHRNGTILTSSGSLRVPEERFDIISTVAHEFFHSWNVERIRPRSLEPFRLDGPNPSGELWFAEGFTSYYEPLILHRAGLATTDVTAATFGRTLDAVIRSPARKYRSAEEVSQLAQFVDQAAWSDQTNWDNTYLSYYTWGAAIGLGLDLSLRVRTDNTVSLDDYMRALWREHGRPQGPAEGLVVRPYTVQDLRDRLAEVSGDRRFADEFFDRYVQGREVVDYQALLAPAGFVLRKQNAGRAWMGPLPVDFSRGVPRVSGPTLEGTPVYVAGLDRDDELLSFDGGSISSADRLEDMVRRRKPGDTVRLGIRRRGATQEVVITLEEDPRLVVVPAESTGRPLSSAERAFRDGWLNSRVTR
jgi:predicted metalloprotease with PDZ domain